MEITWQKKNYKTRQFVSLFYSGLIVWIILLIPIERQLYNTHKEKFIAIEIIKNMAPNNIPETIQPFPSSIRTNTTIPMLPELNMAKSTVESNEYFTQSQDASTQNSQLSEYSSKRTENLYSDNTRKPTRDDDEDSNTQVDTEESESYKHQLLLDHKKERAAFLAQINSELLNSDKKQKKIEITNILENQFTLLPIEKSKKNRGKMKYCSSLKKKSQNCPE